MSQKRRLLNLPISRQERRPRSSLTRLLCRSCCQERLVLKLSNYLLNTRTIRVIFLYNWMQCIDGFSILLQRYVTKGNDAKNPAIFSFCLLPKELS